MRSCCLTGALLAITVAIAAPANALPLNREACDALHAELETLAGLDVPKAIVNGPSWTLTHMPQVMDEVKRYLDIEEQLLFRCSGRKPPDLDPQVAGGPKRKDENKQATGRAMLAAQTSAALADAEKRQGGDLMDVVPAAPKRAPAVRRDVRRAPASAAAIPSPSPELDAAYRQLFPLGR